MDAADFHRTEAWFTRHGGKAVFLGRMAPIFRILISLPAGVERMPFGRFLLLTTAGSLLWNTAFVVAGYLLGELVDRYASVFQYAAVAIAIGLFVAVRVCRVSRRFFAPRPGLSLGSPERTSSWRPGNCRWFELLFDKQAPNTSSRGSS